MFKESLRACLSEFGNVVDDISRQIESAMEWVGRYQVRSEAANPTRAWPSWIAYTGMPPAMAGLFEGVTTAAQWNAARRYILPP
jgi:hypothetical protein